MGNDKHEWTILRMYNKTNSIDQSMWVVFKVIFDLKSDIIFLVTISLCLS